MIDSHLRTSMRAKPQV